MYFTWPFRGSVPITLSVMVFSHQSKTTTTQQDKSWTCEFLLCLSHQTCRTWCERHHRNVQVQLLSCCLVVVLSLSCSGVKAPLVALTRSSERIPCWFTRFYGAASSVPLDTPLRLGVYSSTHANNICMRLRQGPAYLAGCLITVPNYTTNYTNYAAWILSGERKGPSSFTKCYMDIQYIYRILSGERRDLARLLNDIWIYLLDIVRWEKMT